MISERRVSDTLWYSIPWHVCLVLGNVGKGSVVGGVGEVCLCFMYWSRGDEVATLL